MDYRDTLNLPKTKFKMKANLNQKEPLYLKRWDMEFYDRLSLIRNQQDGSLSTQTNL